MAETFDAPRYCGRCGEFFDGRANVCPECGGEWPRTLPTDLVAAYALLLTEIHNLRRRGEITESTFLTLRRIYEERLIAVRPDRKPKPVPMAPPAISTPVTQPAAMAAPPAAATIPIQPVPAAVRPAAMMHAPAPAREMPPPPPKPPGHFRRDLRNWAARRQADLVLYLGAFLLSISALIFVSYQGSGGIAKSGLFAVYTALFLVLGLQLGKWKRVQEAGPVFLAIGAILTPLNFVALYTNVLRNEDVAQEYVWLAGSSATAALYSLLALRGFSRFYWIPGGVAYFAAYASLGACLQIPAEWFGPWFMALAVAVNAVAQRLPEKVRRYVEPGAYVLGVPSLLFTHASLAIEGGAHPALAAAYALATAGIARSAFPSRRPLFLGILPPAAVMTVAAAAWSIDGWSENVIAWAPAWLLAVSGAYLAIARIKPAIAEVWASLSLALGVAAVGLAHFAVVDGDIAWRLPVAYGLSAVVAGGWFAERRYNAALALVPALIAAAAASALWAADALAFEWLGSFAAAAGLGYAVLARIRFAPAQLWRTLAALSAGLALATSHIAASEPGIYRWELATAYGLVAAGAAFDALRFRPSSVVSVFALALGGAAALWAFEVGFAWWAFPALAIGLVIVATEMLWTRDEALKRLAWPSALLLSLSPLPILDPLVAEPWVGAASFGGTALVMFALALRTNGAFAALAGYTSQRAATFERQMLARVGSWALFAAGGMVDIALGLSAVESAWTFAVAGIVLWLAVAGLRKRISSLDEVLGPVGLSAVAVAIIVGRDSPGAVSMMAGLFAVAASVAVGGRYAMGWRAAYAGSALLALGFAHGHAGEVGTDAWELPAAYGLALAAILWDSAWNRFQPAMLFAPAIATFGAASAVWWREWPDQHMAWTPLALALGIAATEQLWMRGAIVRKGAWPYVLVLGLAPVTQLNAYEVDPWYGVAGFALATAAWAATTVRSNGALGALIGLRVAQPALRERQALAIGAFGLGLVTIAYTSYALEVPQVRAAWAAAGASWASWAAIIALRKRIASFEEVIGPASLAGIIVAVFASYPHHDHTALILGVTSVAAALTVGGRFAPAWRVSYAAAAAGSILFAHNQAELVGTEAWQFPAAYGLVLLALLWDSAWNRFQPAMLAIPAVAAVGATTAGWWREWPFEHLAWAPLGIAIAIAATERLWMRGELVRKGAWPYVLLLSLVPFALLEIYQDEAWAGAGAFALGTIAWGVAAWRSSGAVGELFDIRSPRSARGEQQAIALGAFGLGLVTLGHFNYALDIPLAGAAWTFAAVGAATILTTCVPAARVRDWLGTMTTAGVSATAIGVGAALEHNGELAAMFGLAAGTFLASGLTNRSDARVIFSAVLAAGSAAFTWAWADWPMWSLSLTYCAVAVGLFGGLAPLRKSRAYLPHAVTFLSAAPIMLSVALAVFSVLVRDLDQNIALFDDPVDTVSIVRTPEWAAMAIAVAIAGLMLVAEGLYRTGRRMAVAGSVVVLVGAELGIAMLKVDNVQVHTVPIALYLIGLGLSFRRSEPLFGQHMLLHEALFVAGAAVLVLPPTEQSFEPGGANWGLLVIGEGMAFLALGLSLFQRWLAVGGVVTLVGVAGRFVFDNASSGRIPYWAMLGVAGLALLGVGVLMLLERDWWDRTKARIGRWWLEGDNVEPPPTAPQT